MFPKMVVQIAGRMYYDLTNWYILVFLLPGYRFNRTFFEKMLGVDKQEDLLADQSSGFTKWFVELPRTCWQVCKIVFIFVTMGTAVRRFNRGFDSLYKDLQSLNLNSDKDKSEAHGIIPLND